MDYAELGYAVLDGIKKIIFWKRIKRYVKYKNDPIVQEELKKRRDPQYNDTSNVFDDAK